MKSCKQELCANWTGDGRACTCALLGIEPEESYEYDESAWVTVSLDAEE